MIFQDPASALNPVLTIRRQLSEALVLHRGLSGRALQAECKRLLDLVGIPDAERRLSAYPHEFSGGQNQRIMIAMALAGNPDLLIADEPTTALDVTIQAQILELLARIRTETGMAMVLISHDLGVVAENCDRVAVMYAGRVVENAPAGELFDDPRHPYANGLIGALPPLDGERKRLTAIAGTVPDPRDMPRRLRVRAAMQSRRGRVQGFIAAAGADRRRAGRGLPCRRGAARISARAGGRMTEPLVQARGLKKIYVTRRGLFGRASNVCAVDDVSFEIARGEVLGLVGESGSGKSTTGRLVLGFETVDAGEATFDGAALPAIGSDAWRAQRARAQMIYQDPLGALDRRLTILAAGSRAAGHSRHRRARRARPGGARAAPLGGPVGRTRAPLSRRVVRRAAPARRAGAGARHAPGLSRLRRAGQRARRVDPGAGRQPACAICKASSG